MCRFTILKPADGTEESESEDIEDKWKKIKISWKIVIANRQHIID